MRVTVALVLSVLAIAGAVLYASESQRNVAEENYHEAIVARQLTTDMLARENSLHEFLATGEARTLASIYMRLADRALYAAKQNGRDRVEATSSAGHGLRRREAAEALVAETAADA